MREDNQMSQMSSPPSSDDTEQQADSTAVRAQEAQNEQTALIDSSPVEQRYSAEFDAEVQAKYGQADRLENSLESLIGQQTAKMQSVQDQKPGLLSLPGSRSKWDRQMQQQQRIINLLHNRLETVREIRDAMAPHGPKLEELAARKLRFKEPSLASEWMDMRVAQRQHQELQRRKNEENKSREQKQGKSLSLGLSHSK